MGETIVIQCYCFIEFKYKLAEIEKRVVRYEDVFCSDFKFKTQGAYDNGRYSVYENIERMENIKKLNFITNQSTYWTHNQENGKLACNCPLALDCDKNSKKYTNAGEILYQDKNKKDIRRALYIEKEYELNWKDFKTLNNSGRKNKLFRCLFIDLNNSRVK